MVIDKFASSLFVVFMVHGGAEAPRTSSLHMEYHPTFGRCVRARFSRILKEDVLEIC